MGTIKTYLAIAGSAILAIFYAIFKATKRENEVLKVVNKAQEEQIHVHEVTDKVTEIVHKDHIIKEASIEASTQALKEDIKNETTTPDTPLDPEFIRMLNKNRNKV